MRISSFSALGLALGLTAFLACGGGESASQEQAAEAKAAGAEAAAKAQTAAGGAQEQMAQHMEHGQEGQMAMPEGVTMEMVKQGKEIYAGAGLCYVCHGAEGQGMPGLGANLADAKWVHSDGSFQGIVKSVAEGVDASKSTTGTAMPAKGGSGITDEQVKAVSAYVFSLKHKSK